VNQETAKEIELPIKDEETPISKPARQARSTSWRIAFWASLIGAIANIGGFASLTAINGTLPDPNTTVTAIFWIVSAIILATRLRWAPLVSFLLSIGSIYLLAVQPYVVESLVNPKTDPNGGFGHFVGVMLIISCALIVLVSSFAAFRQRSSESAAPVRPQAPRWLSIALGAIVGIFIGALFIGILVQPATASGTTYTNGVPTIHMGASAFSQASVTIPKGSKLLLVDDVSSLHIFANGSWQNGTPHQAPEAGAPTVTNLQVNGNSIEIGPFNTTGTFHIYCIIHQGMNLTITVQ
jgi:plastocyanin